MDEGILGWGAWIYGDSLSRDPLVSPSTLRLGLYRLSEVCLGHAMTGSPTGWPRAPIRPDWIRQLDPCGSSPGCRSTHHVGPNPTGDSDFVSDPAPIVSP